MKKYPKLKSKKECAYPERDKCNWDENPSSTRCPYMKYNNSKGILDSTRWECTFKKEVKDFKKEDKSLGSTNNLKS